MDYLFVIKLHMLYNQKIIKKLIFETKSLRKYYQILFLVNFC